MEKREKALRDRSEQLADAGEKLAVCQSQVKEINGMTEDLKGLSGIYKVFLLQSLWKECPVRCAAPLSIHVPVL